MSVSNGERLVTKQDLADMYQGILPYLGGMPEMVANKFSKGDLYSTDEKIIGQWIDGKPLYQKSFNIGALGTTTKVYITDLPDTYDVINQWGFYTNGNNAYMLGYVDPRDVSWRATIATNKTNSKININIVINSDWTGYTVYATLQYTKQSDTAISIGSDTDYSTDEKIVGTWIDGKPLYQRTYSLNTDLPSSSGNPRSVNITIDGLSSIGIDNVVSTSIITKGKDNYAGSYLTSSCGQNLNSYLDVSNSRLQVFQLQTGDANQFTVKAFTIQYTKTTD